MGTGLLSPRHGNENFYRTANYERGDYLSLCFISLGNFTVLIGYRDYLTKNVTAQRNIKNSEKSQKCDCACFGTRRYAPQLENIPRLAMQRHLK